MSQLLVEDFNNRPRDSNEHRSRVRAPAPAESTGTRPWSANITSKAFTVAIVIALWVGWLNRDDNGLTPVSGIGYWLGIAGSSLMLILLLYPLRKRMRALRVIGTITFWFRAHMILGVLGPVLVLWHANFHLGSINSSVALLTTLVVAASGIVGRYLHSKIHLDLYGRKAKAREVLANADDALSGLIRADPRAANRVIAGLNAFAQLGTANPRGLLTGLCLLLVTNWQGAVARKRLVALARPVIAVEGERRGWSKKIRSRQLARITDFVTQQISAAKKAANFAFYERLFRLWHVLHVPLFILLVIVALIHVFAAHFF
jgi:hypothetical protein